MLFRVGLYNRFLESDYNDAINVVLIEKYLAGIYLEEVVSNIVHIVQYDS